MRIKIATTQHMFLQQEFSRYLCFRSWFIIDLMFMFIHSIRTLGYNNCNKTLQAGLGS